mmetsp:Transcript_125181/g.279276  ORF Transcript_125181/g.279276 Transcript_125181/m.279276 type:complete len:596 (+) Transcript_125181:97-1884(+)
MAEGPAEGRGKEEVESIEEEVVEEEDVHDIDSDVLEEADHEEEKVQAAVRGSDLAGIGRTSVTTPEVVVGSNDIEGRAGRGGAAPSEVTSTPSRPATPPTFFGAENDEEEEDCFACKHATDSTCEAAGTESTTTPGSEAPVDILRGYMAELERPLGGATEEDGDELPRGGLQAMLSVSVDCYDQGEMAVSMDCYTPGVGSGERRSAQDSDCTPTASGRPAAVAQVSGAVDASSDTEEVVTDEGRALAQALREAQAALDAARQFVSSPWDRKAAGVSPPTPATGEPLAPEVKPCLAPAAVSEAAAPKPYEATSRTDGSSVARTRIASSSVASSPRSDGGALSARAAEGPRRENLNALHARFGEGAARARVERAKESEREERQRRRAEAEEEAAQEAEKALFAEVHRREASRRAASERRAKREQERQEEAARAAMQARLKASQATGQRYAKSAARRAESERVRREELTRRVLSDLETLQNERNKASETSGAALQQRCQDANWDHAKPVVETRRRPAAAAGARAASVDSGTAAMAKDPAAGEGPAVGTPRRWAPLPRLLQPQRGRGAAPSRGRHPGTCACHRLPPPLDAIRGRANVNN